MSNQPGTGSGVVPGATGAELGDPNDPQTELDQGVPVGSADAEADAQRASGEERDSDDDDGSVFDQVVPNTATDEGVPVGAADAEQDRLNASRDD